MHLIGQILGGGKGGLPEVKARLICARLAHEVGKDIGLFQFAQEAERPLRHAALALRDGIENQTVHLLLHDDQQEIVFLVRAALGVEQHQAVAEYAHLLLNGRDQTGKKRRGDVRNDQRDGVRRDTKLVADVLIGCELVLPRNVQHALARFLGNVFILVVQNLGNGGYRDLRESGDVLDRHNEALLPH